MSNSVAVVCDLREDVSTLVTRVTHGGTTTSGAVASMDWVISTKYYTAPVQFVHCAWDHPPEAPCHAVIFSASKLSAPSTKQLGIWAEYLDRQAPGVCLFACSGSVADLCGWCIDNGVEFIDTDLVTTNDKEKEGYDRVLEALEANVWPHMSRLPSVKRVPRSVELPTTSEASNTTAESTHQPNLPQSSAEALFKTFAEEFPADPAPTEKPSSATSTPHPQTTSPPSNTTPLTATTPEPPKSEPAKPKPNKPEPPSNTSKSPSSTSPSAAPPADFTSPDFWKHIDQDEIFQEAFSQLAQLRLQAQSLPDDQRRELAKNVALAFAKHLGDDDDTDEDDDL
ncbi:alpha- and gamma-adaptin-binding protein p34 [Pelomyxa schiedti]|nr:alpha- and gamma-adaptin-binding protein p34 [Pelomyxa schiedti]